MGRKSVYNKIVNDDLWENVSPENKELINDFVEYKESGDKSTGTIYQYQSALKIFFVWNYQYNNNKFFGDIKKKDLIKFSNYLIKDLNSSAKRRTFMKSSLSTLSNYIEDVLSDEDERFENFRNVTKAIEITANEAIRKKTIVSEKKFKEALDKMVVDKQYQLACFFALAGYSGARKSELLRFKVNYFNDIVFDCLYKTPEPIKTKGKSSKGKLLYKYTLVEIKPYLDLWLEERKQLNLPDTFDYLFITKEDDLYVQAKKSTADSWAVRIQNKYLYEPFYCHSMRHYYVTFLKRHGISDDVIVEIMGWSKSGGSAMLAIYNDMEIEETMEGAFDALKNN